jgi:hypothetical protein
MIDAGKMSSQYALKNLNTWTTAPSGTSSVRTVILFVDLREGKETETSINARRCRQPGRYLEGNATLKGRRHCDSASAIHRHMPSEHTARVCTRSVG